MVAFGVDWLGWILAQAEPTKEMPPTTRAVAMMAEVNQLFADWITAQPAEWLCAKRRWPKALHRKFAGAA